MNLYALKNATTGTIIAHQVRRAKSPWLRTVGFLSRDAIEPDEGLWFDRCSAVHTIGMRSALDLIFLDKSGCVISVLRAAKPNQAWLSAPGAATIVELGPSSSARAEIGERLTLEPI